MSTTVWTRQVPQVWDEIQNTGRYLVLEEYVRAKNGEISDYYIELYRWFTEEARSRYTMPDEAKFPIWVTVDEGQKLPPAPQTICLTLEVPDDALAIVDYDQWGYRENHGYVPLDVDDERAHNEELKRYGIGNEAALITGEQGNFYPQIKRKIQASWQRVFDAPNPRMDLNVGAIWQIVPEWVKEVEFYDETYADQWAEDFSE
ncbi:MAG: DUF3841 domain-containing protein [Eggerthellaceae bacterium]|nr:DUF3841 domain-containing protein [Eggerthellaceae bacterium]